MKSALLLALVFLPVLALAQTNATTSTAPKPASSTPKLTRSQLTAAELQKTVDQLTQSNRDLLDLLKKQQGVLEDMQFDRRLQSRQIESLEERLEDTLYQNNQLQNKVTKLEEDAAVRPAETAATAPPQPAADGTATTPAPPAPAPTPAIVDTPPQPPPAPPESYLPKEETEHVLGTMSWNRLFTLKGDGSQKTELFQIQGRSWRVQWHNLDKPGKAYVNTSALFINAFPKDDTIPQKVCSKLGTGGDATELEGPGNYYLKIEASGGSWELAVEDFR